MTTLAEHAARIEEMKAAEQRVRGWLKRDNKSEPFVVEKDLALLLERIDAYEASITWHTDCLTCPKLYDQVYAMEQHEIPELRTRYKNACDDREGLRNLHDLHVAALAKADEAAGWCASVDDPGAILAYKEYQAARAKTK